MPHKNALAIPIFIGRANAPELGSANLLNFIFIIRNYFYELMFFEQTPFAQH